MVGGGGNHPKSSTSSSQQQNHHQHHRKSRWQPSSSTPLGSKPPTKPNPSPSHKPKPSPSQFPPQQPAYGFHMLDRRTIHLADGSVRSYLALPPDYQDLTPPRAPMDPSAANRFLPPPGPLDGFRHAGTSIGEKRKFGNNDDVNGYPGGAETRASKHLRIGGERISKHLEVDPIGLKKAFLHFVKVINENPSQRKNYLEGGKLQCVACGNGSGRSSKDFPDMHSLMMHTYNSDSADLHVDHLGLHKALCVLMGWNYSKPPDNSKAYQFLSANEVTENQNDLIIWPPTVIIHNTITGKGKDGRMEGLGNKAMDSKMRGLGFSSGKSKSLYGREGHLGITLVKFAGDHSGLKDAIRLAEYFENDNCGRKGWARLQPLTLGKDDEKNPNLVKLDERTGEQKRVLYGYLGTAADLDKLDFDTRKKAVIESQREYKTSR